MNEAIGGAAPPDPSGDIGREYYIQMVNATFFQVFDKEGNAISDPIAMNTIWASLGFSSAGDPIIIYDQEANRWIVTEFPPGNQLLVAVSDTNDPLGTWTAYNFGTPSFPDYPKYSIWSNALCVTTNEDGPGTLPAYFIDRQALLNGAANVSIQRLSIPGIGSAPGFFVGTPVDWTGNTPPPANANPMILRLSNDAWGGSTQDEVDIFTVDLDWDNPNNTTVSMLAVPTQAFDTEACAVTGGFGFDCIPQPNGQGIDGIPDVIMHQAHYRNFGTHESMVLNFLVNAGNTEVLAGIRWMELRRTESQDWTVYQEGTFAPEGRIHRFLGGIAIDRKGNIGLAYSTSGESDSPGLRFTGRRATDSLGVMTVDEYVITDGFSNNGFDRYGDYAQMSVDPINERTFWFTSEYRANNGWGTKIVAFEFFRDSIDIFPNALLSPQDASDLTGTETVSIVVKNEGTDTVSTFQVGYRLDNGPEVLESVNFVLPPDSTYFHTFTTTADLSTIGDYSFKLFTALDNDEVPFNDTLRAVVKNLARVDAGITNIIGIEDLVCGDSTELELELRNLGTDSLLSASITLLLNGNLFQTVNWTGALAAGEVTLVPVSVTNILEGNNTLSASSNNPNGMVDPIPANDGFMRSFTGLLDGVSIRLKLRTDDYPAETTWEVRDSNNNIVFSGGMYNMANSLEIEEWCLDPDGCYSFTIYDSYADGICCGFGEGNYEIVDENDIVLASSNGDFGSTETLNFCATFVCMLGADITFTPESETGANDGSLMISTIDGIGPFQYSIDGGQTFQDNSVFDNLPAGDYSVVVTGDLDCRYEETVNVSLCAIMVLVEVENESAPNESDGNITVTGSNGMPPYQYSIDGGTTFQTSKEFPDLSAGMYDVVVQDALGCSTQLDTTLSVLVNTESQLLGYSMEVFPNPSEGLYRINVKGLNTNGPFLKYKVFDVNGRLIQENNLTLFNDTYTGQLSLFAYPDGAYFVRFEEVDLKQMLRVVKIQ